MDKKRALRVMMSLKQLRAPRNPEFSELERFFSSRRGIFGTDTAASREMTARRSFVNKDMLDSSPIQALRVMKSGMQSGMTSPSRPWFRWQPEDEDLREQQSVKEYVASVTNRARVVLAKSGIYGALHSQYGHIGQFGTGAMLLEDDLGSGLLRPILFKPGSYWIGLSAGKRIDTLYRETNMTVEQIVGKFAFNGVRFGEPDWSQIPKHVVAAYDRGDVGKLEKVHHLITPRLMSERDPRMMNQSNKAFASAYWMDAHADSDRFSLMGNVGYDKNRLIVPRWEADEYDPYGYSPACDALPDARELMSKRRDYAEMLRRMNRPTMNAPTELRNSAFSMMPGAVNFMADPTKGLSPAFEVRANFEPLAVDMQASRKSIWSLLYADLFMAISMLPPGEATATEVNLRREEKMLELGPVVERLQDEQDQPILDLVFDAVARSGSAGPPPVELHGQELKVDFISILAQAQKAVSTGAIERLWSFAGNISAANPSILDKLDGDQTIDEYSDILGVPPSIVRSDEDVTKLREQRAQAQRQQQAVDNSKPMADATLAGAQAAKVLSGADSPRGPAPIDTLKKLGLA